MKLNIVKSKKNNDEVVNIVKEVFSASEIGLTNDYGETIDIEVKDKNGGIHSLEGLKELENYFNDYNIRIW